VSIKYWQRAEFAGPGLSEHHLGKGQGKPGRGLSLVLPRFFEHGQIGRIAQPGIAFRRRRAHPVVLIVQILRV
jgi:hypothetical protein